MSNHTFSKAEDATYRAYLYQERRDDFHIGIVLFARKSELYSGLYQFYTIVALMFLLLIPLFGYVVYFIRRNIQHPIDRMLRAPDGWKRERWESRSRETCPIRNLCR